MVKSAPKKSSMQSRPGMGRSSETDELEEKIKNKKLPDHVRDEI